MALSSAYVRSGAAECSDLRAAQGKSVELPGKVYYNARIFSVRRAARFGRTDGR